jgi:hypothetical protein
MDNYYNFVLLDQVKLLIINSVLFDPADLFLVVLLRYRILS